MPGAEDAELADISREATALSQQAMKYLDFGNIMKIQSQAQNKGHFQPKFYKRKLIKLLLVKRIAYLE